MTEHQDCIRMCYLIVVCECSYVFRAIGMSGEQTSSWKRCQFSRQLVRAYPTGRLEQCPWTAASCKSTSRTCIFVLKL